MVFDLIHFIIECALEPYDLPVAKLVFGILVFITLILKQLHLYFRPDFRMAQNSLPNPEASVSLPIAVRFGARSTEEEASYRKDALFDWRL
jgi:hypothetical protein